MISWQTAVMTARRGTFGLVATGSIVVAGLLAGCASNGGSADTLPPIASTTTTIAVTVAPTVTTLPPPTTVPVTLAPTTSTTLAETTTTGETTSTTEVPKGAALILRDDGVGDAVFGADPDEVIAYIRSILGAPSADSGWADPFSSFGVCPGTEVRGVSWGDLTLLFTDSSVITSGRRHFFTYSYGPAFGSTIDPLGAHTTTGISVGSTVADLKAAYPGVVVNPADDIFAANFYINDNLTGFLTGATDTDTITSLTGGISCGE